MGHGFLDYDALAGVQVVTHTVTYERVLLSAGKWHFEFGDAGMAHVFVVTGLAFHHLPLADVFKQVLLETPAGRQLIEEPCRAGGSRTIWVQELESQPRLLNIDLNMGAFGAHHHIKTGLPQPDRHGCRLWFRLLCNYTALAFTMQWNGAKWASQGSKSFSADVGQLFEQSHVVPPCRYKGGASSAADSWSRLPFISCNYGGDTHPWHDVGVCVCKAWRHQSCDAQHGKHIVLAASLGSCVAWCSTSTAHAYKVFS